MVAKSLIGPLVAVATIHCGAAQAEPRAQALPVIEMSSEADGVRLTARVEGSGGEVDAELTVLREAGGSKARTRQSRTLTLTREPQTVSTLTLAGGSPDHLEATLVVTHDGKVIARTTTELTP